MKKTSTILLLICLLFCCACGNKQTGAGVTQAPTQVAASQPTDEPSVTEPVLYQEACYPVGLTVTGDENSPTAILLCGVSQQTGLIVPAENCQFNGMSGEQCLAAWVQQDGKNQGTQHQDVKTNLLPQETASKVYYADGKITDVTCKSVSAMVDESSVTLHAWAVLDQAVPENGLLIGKTDLGAAVVGKDGLWQADLNGDGKKETVACNGVKVVVDGVTLDEPDEGFVNNTVTSVVAVIDLNGDGSSEVVTRQKNSSQQICRVFTYRNGSYEICGSYYSGD